MRRYGVLILLLASVLSGCQGMAASRAMTPSPDLLGQRQLQIRRFDDIGEKALLAACAGLLQDLGFTIDESETGLGLLVASKKRRAEPTASARLAQLLGLIVGADLPLDEKQLIRASLVTTPVRGEARSYRVRVTFQRIVWNTENVVSRREPLQDPELYQRFFDALSKSLFLEAHSI